jgi:geranylgeranyl pyrophosphate synthase
LASDALLTSAFDLVSETAREALAAADASADAGHSSNPSSLALPLATRVLQATSHLLTAIGHQGVIYGQWLDLEAEGKITTSSLQPEAPVLSTLSPAEGLKLIHRHKTGDLIVASLLSGFILSGGGEPACSALTTYGKQLGLCFQITDDILDVTKSAQELGKTPGKDAHSGKLTYVSLYGLDESKRLARAASEQALAALAVFAPDQATSPASSASAALAQLRQLATAVLERTH